MNDLLEVVVWVLVDANGEYAVGGDEDQVTERYSDDVGGNTAQRLVKVVLSVPRPQAVTLRGVVPAEVTQGVDLVVS